MTTLIVNLSSGKGTWGNITNVMNNKEWNKIIVITNEFSKDHFKPEKVVEYIIIDSLKTSITKLIDDLTLSLKEKLENSKEIKLNIISGNGKEHMSILSALNNLNISYNLIALTGKGIIEI